jgi:hypothetical protein
MEYFDKAEVLHPVIFDEPDAGSVELSSNIKAELKGKGKGLKNLLKGARWKRLLSPLIHGLTYIPIYIYIHLQPNQ